ncbi:ski oncogene-like isoform X2 [Branchiostoma floridae]|uniref:Ski oncogene-like isoform X2 n=2 Tax=Branchiostoma floridae TaxID=7739 RepID=A0A9J7KQK3_BRAFL|nr:ski oncogene-like isoform X2 [Branchiostoma floridae]
MDGDCHSPLVGDTAPPPTSTDPTPDLPGSAVGPALSCGLRATETLPEPEASPMKATLPNSNQVRSVVLCGVPIISLMMEGKDRLCLAQISNTLLKSFSYNEIHNRRVALGITCVQCTPVQLELLRRAGAMPISSRRCGMITKREAERLCKSFFGDTTPPKLPENFAFEVAHECSWGCRGRFYPSRYNSSRAKCVKCIFCNIFFSPNKFIFHCHRMPDSKYKHPDAANFNAWRRHLKLAADQPPNDLLYAWEDVKAMFNGGNRKRALSNACSSASQSHAKKQKFQQEQKMSLEQTSMPTFPLDPSFPIPPFGSKTFISPPYFLRPQCLPHIPICSSAVSSIHDKTSTQSKSMHPFVLDNFFHYNFPPFGLPALTSDRNQTFRSEGRESPAVTTQPDLYLPKIGMASTITSLRSPIVGYMSAFRPVLRGPSGRERGANMILPGTDADFSTMTSSEDGEDESGHSGTGGSDVPVVADVKEIPKERTHLEDSRIAHDHGSSRNWVGSHSIAALGSGEGFPNIASGQQVQITPAPERFGGVTALEEEDGPGTSASSAVSENIAEEIIRLIVERRQIEKECQILKDAIHGQMQRELAYREDMARQVQLVRDSLRSEIDQEKATRLTAQQKLKEAHDALHNFSCEMLVTRSREDN